MQTRKYPRTLNEAFGPYAGTKLHPMREYDKPRTPAYEWCIYALCVVAVVVIIWTN